MKTASVDLTKMAKKNLKINTFGYDCFIGREIFKDGKEYFVSLKFPGLGSASSNSLNFMLEDLCDAVKKGKKVLLYKSPGEIGLRRYKASETLKEFQRALRALKSFRKEASYMLVGQDKKDEYYTISGRRYEPLKPEQMNLLKMMYELDHGMKEFPNPFNA